MCCVIYRKAVHGDIAISEHAGCSCFSFCMYCRVALWLWTIAFTRALVWQHSHTEALHRLSRRWEIHKRQSISFKWQQRCMKMKWKFRASVWIRWTACPVRSNQGLWVCPGLERGRLGGALCEGGQAGQRLPGRWSVPQACPCLGGTWTMPFLICSNFWWGLRLLDEVIVVSSAVAGTTLFCEHSGERMQLWERILNKCELKGMTDACSKLWTFQENHCCRCPCCCTWAFGHIKWRQKKSRRWTGLEVLPHLITMLMKTEYNLLQWNRLLNLALEIV